MEAIKNWREEKRSVYLYQIVAKKETDPKRKKMFAELALAANKQAEFWEKEILKTQKTIPIYHPDLRARTVSQLINLLGPKALRPMLAAMKVRGMSAYSVFPNERHHTSFNITNNLRAAVFGANDGLISNASLILGVAGAHVAPHIILISGVAGLLAGACSMAAGEYVSVRSQKEMLEYQIHLERQELEFYPEEEILELSLIYQARGMSKEEADTSARKMIKDPERALSVLAREELGLNPQELVSPMGAAVSSFFFFCLRRINSLNSISRTKITIKSKIIYNFNGIFLIQYWSYSEFVYQSKRLLEWIANVVNRRSSRRYDLFCWTYFKCSITRIIMKMNKIILILISLTLVSCSRTYESQGYIEGRFTYVTSSVSGILKELLVVRGTSVKQGTRLFILESQPESDQYRASVKRVEEAQAAFNLSDITLKRDLVLYQKKVIAKSVLDNAQADYDSNQAKLHEAIANQASANWTQNQKLPYAPVDSIVYDTYFRVGELVSQDRPVVSLLAPGDIKAIFYVGQPQLGFLKLGKKIMVYCDGCSNKIPAQISFISPQAEYTPPVIFSLETNDKLVYRVEAEFDKKDAVHMHPGQPVSIYFKNDL